MDAQEIAATTKLVGNIAGCLYDAFVAFKERERKEFIACFTVGFESVVQYEKELNA